MAIQSPEDIHRNYSVSDKAKERAAQLISGCGSYDMAMLRMLCEISILLEKKDKLVASTGMVYYADDPFVKEMREKISAKDKESEIPLKEETEKSDTWREKWKGKK